MSKYAVHLQGERGGSYTATISTEFTTGKWSNIFDFIKKLNKTKYIHRKHSFIKLGSLFDFVCQGISDTPSQVTVPRRC